MFEVRDVEIRNEAVLESLNKFKDFIVKRHSEGALDKDLDLNAKEHTRDRWLADDYLGRIIDRKKQHEGFPESMRSYQGIMPGSSRKYKSSHDEYRDAATELNKDLMTELAARVNTLVTVYPPGGWISWHNNANASGYNVIFSWSENGDGWFDYWDVDKKERVRIPDHSGWQCKMTYFGSYDEPEKLCYHAAATDCLRISVAYVWGRDEAQHLWEDIIEDIENIE
jgi:hypothetical protein